MEQITKALLALSKFHSRLTHTPESDEYIKQIKTWGAGIMRIVVMGEIMKGKSSFINALLGIENLVPVSSDVATSTVYKIHYGKENGYRVYFKEETGIKTSSISAEEVALYGTEAGNPNNKKQVDFIEVISNSDILKTGLVIIDTPGLGGLFKEHKKITWQHVPKADAVFFVTDSIESPIGKEELEHLKTVREITPHLYFVQTKKSAVNKEEVNKRKENNLNILSKAFNISADQIPYFPLDSILKHRADAKKNVKMLQISGYPALMRFVQNSVINRQQQILKAKSIAFALPTLQTVQQNIIRRKETLSAYTAEKQRETRAAIEKAQQNIAEWKQKGLRDLKEKINDGFDRVARECRNCCIQLRPYSELHMMLENEVNNAQDMQELTYCVSVFETKLPETASACLKTIQQKYETGISELFNGMEVSVSDNTQITLHTVSQKNSRYEVVTKRIEKDAASNRQVDAALKGGVFGVNVGGLIGGAIGSIIPVIGTGVGALVGAAIGACWGGNNASEALREQNLQAAKNHLLAVLHQDISSKYNLIIDVLNSLNQNYRKKVSKALDSCISQQERELQTALDNIINRSKMEAKELADVKKILIQDEKQLQTIKKIIDAN